MMDIYANTTIKIYAYAGIDENGGVSFGYTGVTVKARADIDNTKIRLSDGELINSDIMFMINETTIEAKDKVEYNGIDYRVMKIVPKYAFQKIEHYNIYCNIKEDS